MKKITVIGSGNVGGSIAQRLADAGGVNIVLVDRLGDLARGKSLDLYESLPLIGIDTDIVGTSNYEETAESDVVIITAGIPRKSKMTRNDLLDSNAEIVAECVSAAIEYSPNSILLIVTNPVCAMSHVAYIASKFPKQRVIGLSGLLDTSRMRAFIATEIGVSVESIQALVIGDLATGHFFQKYGSQ